MGAFAGGFVKGLLVGLGAFALGFALLSVVLPPEPESRDTARVTPTQAAGDRSATPDAERVNGAGQTLPSLVTPEAQVADGRNDGPEPSAGGAPPEPTPPAGDDEATPTQPDGHDRDAGPVPAAPAIPDVAATGPIEPSIRSLVPPAVPLAGPAVSTPAPLPGSPADPDADNLPQIGEVPPFPVPDAASDAPQAEEPDTRAAAPAVEDPAPSEAGPEQHEAPDRPEAADPPDAQRSPDTQTVRPATGLPQAVEGVVTGRLPRIGADDDDTTTSAETAEDDGPGALAGADVPAADADADINTDAALPAHRRFAAAFDTDTARPHLAIILLDTDPTAETEAALLALDFPLSIAIDPADDDAARRARAYREAGHEVLIHATGLPTRATAADIEVTFASWAATMPEAIALLDPAEGGMRANAALARVAVPALADRGLGLFLTSGGLGGARQAARAAGVATGQIFRDIDEGLEGQHTIRRYLDRAVFEAQRQGGVIVMGRAGHDDTLSALALWRSEGRAADVTYGPASALLALD